MENTRQLTIGELIDYLEQFPETQPVYLYADEIPEPGDGVALDILSFTVDTSQ